MTTLQLFKNCKIDNINHVSSFGSTAEQNTYYQGLIAEGNGLNLTALNFKHLGDPINIKGDYDELFTYNYGRIKIKDTWYYFSVYDISYIRDEITQIHYRFDPWETVRCQHGATLGEGFVERGKITAGNVTHWIPQTDIQPRTLKYTRTNLFDSSDTVNRGDGVSILTVCGNSSTNMNINMITLKPTANIYDFLMKVKWADILSEDPLNLVGDEFAISDLRGAWVIPFTYGISARVDHKHELVHTNYGCDLYGVENRTGPDRNYALDFNFDLKGPLFHRDTERTFLTDMRGTEIYTPPYGVEYTGKVHVKANVSYNSCIFRCYINGDRTNPEKRFTIMGEPLPVMGDAFNEYFVRQRQTDIEGRRIARNEQLAKALTGAITGGAQAGVMGGIAGGGLQQAGLSAVAGGGGAVVGSLINYGLDTHFGHQQQTLLDSHYRAQRDELELTGDAPWVYEGVKIVKEEWDEWSRTRFENYIAVNGHKVHHYLTNCSPFYVSGGTLKGDFTINGNIPDNWKQEIRQRFRTGVRIVE